MHRLPIQPLTFDGERFYPVPDAAALLGISPRALYRAIRAGKVRVPTVGPMRVSQSEIRRVLAGEPLESPATVRLRTARDDKREVDAARKRIKELCGWLN